ncbi:hypothetical protein AMTRI_Chr04g189500 [Amborella trichopoda]
MASKAAFCSFQQKLAPSTRKPEIPTFRPYCSLSIRTKISSELSQDSAETTKEPLITKFRLGDSSVDGSKILLQPRVCTLRAYGDGIVRSKRPDSSDMSPFFAFLSDYIDNSRKSEYVELLSGRLAMVAFTAALTKEMVTGNSLFGKLDAPRILEAIGVCLVAVLSAAAFAWFSSARVRVGQIISLKCNAFVDSLINNLVDSLFYEEEFPGDV